MSELETFMGGVDTIVAGFSPDDIAKVVTSHIFNFDQITHGFPATSPVGLRALIGLPRKYQDILIEKGQDAVHQFVDADLREHGNDIDTAIHVTWRHANRLQRYIKSLEAKPLERDFAVVDSPQVRWTLVEPAFRASAGILLSRLVNTDEQSPVIPVEQPEYVPGQSISSVTQQYGLLAVKNCVRYDMSGIDLVASSYMFQNNK